MQALEKIITQLDKKLTTQPSLSPSLKIHDSSRTTTSTSTITSRYEKQFFENIVPWDYRDAALENCDKQPQMLIDFARQWALKPFSVYLYGCYGSGKTHFAYAMIRQMFRTCRVKMWPRAFTSVEFDGKLLEASKSDKGDREWLYDRAREDLLFIDDLGRETKSERLRRQYFEVFNYRHSNNLPTIITSNFYLDQLGDIIDGSLASRMQQWQMIEFQKRDLRKKMQN